MISKGKLILFFKNSAEAQEYGSSELPTISSMHLQMAHKFNLPIEKRIGVNFPPDDCKDNRIFEGTLHISGRSTVKNVYHSIADNFAPMVSQIIMDAYLDKDFLHKPRMFLTGFYPHANSVPHMKLLDDLMSAGSITTDEASGMCFQRIVWGSGPHVLWYDVLTHLRSMVADFARTFIHTMYTLPIPTEFTHTNPNPGSSSNTLHRHGQPMNIVLYSRGLSGKGRSMKGEDKLIQAMSKAGGNAIMCSDYDKLGFEGQIAHAYHADVIIGLHGAALVHGIFAAKGLVSLELKTLYGYKSILFGLVADSRAGVHAQVDVRDYFVSGGHKDMDDALIDRVMNTLLTAVQYAYTGTDSNSTHGQGSSSVLVVVPSSKKPNNPGDFVLRHVARTRGDDDDDVLGPELSVMRDVCRGLAFTAYRDQLGAGAAHDDHCGSCAPF